MYNIPEITAPLFSLSSSTQNLLNKIDDNLVDNYDSFFLHSTNDDWATITTDVDYNDDDIDIDNDNEINIDNDNEEGVFDIDVL